MSLPPLDKYLQAFLETLLMAGASSLIAIVAGLALAIVLHTTAPGGLYARPRLYRGLSAAVNIGRAIPFIILLVALLPVTRAIVGTTLGTWAAVVPLSANLIPFFARIAQVSLGEVDGGLVEAARAMGLRRPQIVRQVLLPEALPGLIGGMTVSVIAMVNASAMAGAVGAGGLGDLAIRYGYERYETRVMFEVIVILVALVSVLQFGGEWLARRADHRRSIS
ncbi:MULTISPECIES: methionine ABC transporter permease [Delftia]|jgi:D-methionine transport system permease protein|uniref:ABC transporter permease n=7 Tax=Pseudomonadati TaxID=3379134 RepID=A0AAX3SJS7_9BURK|nr:MULTISPECIES: methionine ABC transporter permease [Delftia]KAA9179497.1 ABC transporter permease [Delftia sp. BR1]KEH13878.1 ABC transporter permease [Delftia sp. 670]PIF35904.1 D-methionine transport system permease protein [Burkholderiales bacterium 23]AEF88028.1 ABC-type transporter, integral membrane subunit [Delftia sp. Cs1-4]AOV04719.1 ABC transporter permease [Delftia tsuruhatensis]